MKFYYVYILVSQVDPERHYTGYTEDVKQRLDEHNAGKLPNTKRYRPWRVSSAHAFCDKSRALAFELYLKSGSGREFARRHF